MTTTGRTITTEAELRKTTASYVVDSRGHLYKRVVFMAESLWEPLSYNNEDGCIEYGVNHPRHPDTLPLPVTEVVRPAKYRPAVLEDLEVEDNG